jgi:murein DD-endopeptidase MepM/ murein hydrolase activator NlpD
VDFVNSKGSFKEGNPGGKKGFFKESGFYIVIVVVLCALAAGAVYFSTNQILTDPDQEQAQEDQQAQENNLAQEDKSNALDLTNPDYDESDQSSLVDDGSEYADEGPYVGMGDDALASEGEQAAADSENQAANDTAKNAAAPKAASNDDEQAKSASANTVADSEDNVAAEDVVLAIVKPAFQSPVSGKIQAAYSMDKLVFSPTFSDWRTHSGTDIAAPRGEVVRAVGKGTVLEIKNDPRYGFIVVLDHKNGYKSLYANLATDQTLKVGQEVKQGDPVGSIGATAIFESAEPTHLHFELYKENKLVDPAAYIDITK